MKLPQKKRINPQVAIGEPVEWVWKRGKISLAIQKFSKGEGVLYHEHLDVRELVIRLGDKPIVSLTGKGCQNKGHSFIACYRTTLQLSIKLG